MTANFVHTIGRDSYRSQAEFEAEARKLGISRRVGRLPDDLEVGKSKVFLAYDTGLDTAPRRCREPGCASVNEKTGKMQGCRLPAPVRSEDGNLVYTTCEQCKTVYPGKPRAPGKITSYFVPSAVELVIRCSDSAVRELARAYIDLGVLNAEVEEGPDLLRVGCRVTDETVTAVVQALAAAGADVGDITLLSAKAMTVDRVLGVAGEPRRGCGFRGNGGTYVVGGAGDRAIVEVSPFVPYHAGHFRGFRKLTSEESEAMDRHLAGGLPVLQLPFAGKAPRVRSKKASAPVALAAAEQLALPIQVSP